MKWVCLVQDREACCVFVQAITVFWISWPSHAQLAFEDELCSFGASCIIFSIVPSSSRGAERVYLTRVSVVLPASFMLMFKKFITLSYQPSLVTISIYSIISFNMVALCFYLLYLSLYILNRTDTHKVREVTRTTNTEAIAPFRHSAFVKQIIF